MAFSINKRVLFLHSTSRTRPWRSQRRAGGGVRKKERDDRPVLEVDKGEEDAAFPPPFLIFLEEL